MKNLKKVFGLVVSLGLVVTCTSNVNAISTISTIQGNNRYETAAKIAEKQKYTVAILVNSDKSLADGLSASGLSGVVDAPILLSQTDSIPTVTLNRLNGVMKLYIIGGVGSISKNVENQIKEKGIEVKRIDGNDRIQTSYNVAKEINNIKPVQKIILTNAFKGEPDAMSVASVAVRDNSPIILTNGTDVPFDNKGTESYVIGGINSMSENLAKKTSSTRLGGKDRFETNKQIINKFYPGKKEFYIAKSHNLVDALTGSVIAKNDPIVLVNNGSDKSILKDAQKVTALGGISNSIIQECLDAANGTNTEADNIKKAELAVKNKVHDITGYDENDVYVKYTPNDNRFVKDSKITDNYYIFSVLFAGTSDYYFDYNVLVDKNNFEIFTYAGEGRMESLKGIKKSIDTLYKITGDSKEKVKFIYSPNDNYVQENKIKRDYYIFMMNTDPGTDEEITVEFNMIVNKKTFEVYIYNPEGILEKL